MLNITVKPLFDVSRDHSIYFNIHVLKLLAKLSITGILNILSWLSLFLLNEILAIVGISVNDTKTEIITETDMATAISRNNCPTGRSTIKTGIKTTTVVNAEPKIGFHTCKAPFNDAFSEFKPDWLSLYMFSWLTIEASTTIPTAKAKPAKEMTFIESPKEEIITNVPTTETGIANIIISVGLKFLKKIIKTQIARIPPMIMFCWTKSIALLM